jgi:hypothetical protein
VIITPVLFIATWAGIQYAGIGHIGCYLGVRWSAPHARRQREHMREIRRAERRQPVSPQPQQWRETRTWMLQRSLSRGVKPVLEAS